MLFVMAALVECSDDAVAEDGDVVVAVAGFVAGLCYL